MSYAKLSSTIVNSTIWAESDRTLRVWIGLLALADAQGQIIMSRFSLRKVLEVSFEDLDAALEIFMSPDPHSRSKQEEGRRVKIIEGGWELVNYPEYRALNNEESRRARNAEYQRRHRNKGKKESEWNVRKKSDKTDGQQMSALSAHADADADADAEADAEAKENTYPPYPPTEREEKPDLSFPDSSLTRVNTSPKKKTNELDPPAPEGEREEQGPAWKFSEQFVKIWNTHKAFPPIRALSPDRERKILTAAKELKTSKRELIALLPLVIQAMSEKAWVQQQQREGTTVTLDSLSTNGKLLGFFEEALNRQEALNERPESEAIAQQERFRTPSALDVSFEELWMHLYRNGEFLDKCQVFGSNLVVYNFQPTEAPEAYFSRLKESFIFRTAYPAVISVSFENPLEGASTYSEYTDTAETESLEF
jgi:hypothetical protein